MSLHEYLLFLLWVFCMYISTQLNFSNSKGISFPTVWCLFIRCLYFFHLTAGHVSPTSKLHKTFIARAFIWKRESVSISLKDMLRSQIILNTQKHFMFLSPNTCILKFAEAEICQEVYSHFNWTLIRGAAM